MASSPTSAPTAGVPAATTHNPTATPKRSVSKYCVPTTSAVPCAGCHAPAASLGRPSPVGSKKEAALPGLSETLAEPDPAEAAPAALELDELWSFVLKRANKRWIRVAPPRATRQVVAYAVGGRSRATCRKLWAAAPEAYRRAHCLSDFREAYQLVIPSEQRTAAGKESGLTAHVERWNNTLRQRVGRFVRKSLSFSKPDAMHELCLRLFLHGYNKSLALSCD